jgi:single-strand DNA-binding protein
MANINRVFLAGNLTRDPQVRFLANEKAVAEFGLAINRKFKAGDGSLKEEVTFVDIEVWGRTAELCSQYLTKGRSCMIEGRLKLDQWEDKKDGSKRSKLRVVADNVQFLDSKGREAGAQDEGDLAGAVSPAAAANAPPTAANGMIGANGEQVTAKPLPSPAAPRARQAAAAAPVAGDDEPPF